MTKTIRFKKKFIVGTAGNALGRHEIVGLAKVPTAITFAKWEIFKLFYDAKGDVQSRAHAKISGIETFGFVHKWADAKSGSLIF